MKRLILIIFIFFISLSNASLKAEERYDISRYFPMDVGNEWVYVYKIYSTERGGVSEGGTRVSSIQSKQILNGREIYLLQLEQDKKSIFYHSLGKEGVYLHKIAYEDECIVFSPPILLFPDTFEFNQELKVSSSVRVYDSNGALTDEGIINGEVIVEGIEDITVPAGRFKDCLRTSFSLTRQLRTNLKTMTNTSWLAQGVGKVREKQTVTVYAEKETDCKEIELKRATIKGKKIAIENN